MSGSNPGWTDGFVPSATEWNAEWAAKADYSQVASASSAASAALVTANVAITLASAAQPAIEAGSGYLLGGPSTLAGELELITISSGLNLNAGILSATEFNITDGTVVIDAVNNLTVSNLGLTSEVPNPVIIQSNDTGSGASTISTYGNVTAGNLLVILLTGENPVSTPSGWTSSASHQSTVPSTAQIFTKVATSTSDGTGVPIAGTANWGAIYEVSGYELSAISASAGATTGSPAQTIPSQSPAAGSLILTIFADVNGGPPSYTSRLPSGSTQDYVSPGTTQFYGTTQHYFAPGGPITIGVSNTAHSAPVYATIAIPSSSSVVAAKITPTIPITINGTLEGGFQSMTITTGNTATSASLSGSSLIINLGAP